METKQTVHTMHKLALGDDRNELSLWMLHNTEYGHKCTKSKCAFNLENIILHFMQLKHNKANIIALKKRLGI